MTWTHLAERARLLFYLQSFSRLLLFWLPISVGMGMAASTSMGWFAGLATGAAWLFVMFVVALWYPALSWSRWAYSLREDDLLIARGVLVRSVSAIPMQRIQHVDLRQGPLDQWLGLARLDIYTASGMGADGVIPGLELPVAESLRDRLVHVEGDDGV